MDNPLGFDDRVQFAQLETRIEFLQDARRQYEDIAAKLIAAAESGDPAVARSRLAELDALRDAFDRRIGDVRDRMDVLGSEAIAETKAREHRLVNISLLLLLLAGLLGIGIAAAITRGLVRPISRLVKGTAAVEAGALDTIIPVQSSDEIGQLTESFNRMVRELGVKEQIRKTFGKYVDPRIVEGLIDRPELTDPKGARHEMTILFCDMQNFTGFSEGLTPGGLVTVMNRFLTVISEPVLRNGGVVDKYVGDAVMAFWGPPFVAAGDHARLACLAAIEQLEAIPGYQDELPDLTGVRRGMPRIGARIGIATGDVVVGSIGSEQHRNYTVLGDTVNIASRFEGANKVYGTRILISERSRLLAGDLIEVREIDSVRVVGKSEPERIFELLGHKGNVAPERLELRDTFGAALADYREQRWDKAADGFRDCLTIVPGDAAAQVFLDRIAQYRINCPAADWQGVWSLTEK
jgi:adenylate cyclase